MHSSKSRQHRLDRLQEHLRVENADLMKALDAYRQLDAVAHKMGLLDVGQSYANNISWWPLISVLGTFSAGKSSFINSYIGLNLQKTGNQAVDDHFTVITYGRAPGGRTLPGQALDSDPRFPFYRISEAIEDVAPGEGRRIDRYLQMRVAPSEVLKGKIIIDSPGFDADAQRSSTLKITSHIIGLSDLVLVFFDARHPEVGAMQDTLRYLVRDTLNTVDADKFVFILNQIDTSAQENNLEDIVAAWRSSLAQNGLNAGKFFLSFNKEAAIPIENKEVWKAYEAKRDADYAEIEEQLNSVNTFRTYRIVGRIKMLANAIEEKAVPTLKRAFSRWRRQVLVVDAAILAALMALVLLQRETLFSLSPLPMLAAIAGMGLAALALHFTARYLLANRIAATLDEQDFGHLGMAFRASTRLWRPMFLLGLKGWNSFTRRRLDAIRDAAERLIEDLNTRNADPSGRTAMAPPALAAPAPVAAAAGGGTKDTAPLTPPDNHNAPAPNHASVDAASPDTPAPHAAEEGAAKGDASGGDTQADSPTTIKEKWQAHLQSIKAAEPPSSDER